MELPWTPGLPRLSTKRCAIDEQYPLDRHLSWLKSKGAMEKCRSETFKCLFSSRTATRHVDSHPRHPLLTTCLKCLQD